MNITILTAGSRGDVQPYVALGLGLKQAGHSVRLPAPEIFRDLATLAGLDLVPIHSFSPQDFVKRPDIQDAIHRGNQLQVLNILLKEAEPMMESMLGEFWNACQGTDLVITSGIFFTASEGAEKLGVPWMPALLAPYSTTREFPAPFISGGRTFGGAYNRLTHQLFEQMIWQAGRRAINHRRKILGLRGYPFFGPYRRLRDLRIPFLFAFSPTVISPPTDWPTTHHITGYWFLDESMSWQPPTELVRFLEAGPPPVCIGFGSMDNENPEKITRLAVEAIKRSGQRGIFLTGWAGSDTDDLPESMYRAEAIPHDWLFPRVASVVHHGGAGTTAACLRAGKPTIITPFGGDQFFWQKVVTQLGVGPLVPPFKRLTSDDLGRAIATALTDLQMQARATKLGEKIRGENGIANAVNAIHQYVQ
jgi:sterol 3beta-glucosyltransferase